MGSRIPLPDVGIVVEQKAMLDYSAGSPELAIETKRIPKWGFDDLQPQIVDATAGVWPGIWKTEDGRYFLVTEKEVEWFTSERDLKQTLSALFNLGGVRR